MRSIKGKRTGCCCYVVQRRSVSEETGTRGWRGEGRNFPEVEGRGQSGERRGRGEGRVERGEGDCRSIKRYTVSTRMILY